MEENRTYGQIFEAVKSEDVKTAVLQNQKVILDYTAKWCNPCKKLEPILKNFASTFPNILILKIDIDNQEFSDLIEQCSVKNLPTIQFYHNQEMIGDIVGFKEEEFPTYLNDFANK